MFSSNADRCSVFKRFLEVGIGSDIIGKMLPSPS